MTTSLWEFLSSAIHIRGLPVSGSPLWRCLKLLSERVSEHGCSTQFGHVFWLGNRQYQRQTSFLHLSSYGESGGRFLRHVHFPLALSVMAVESSKLLPFLFQHKFSGDNPTEQLICPSQLDMSRMRFKLQYLRSPERHP